MVHQSLLSKYPWESARLTEIKKMAEHVRQAKNSVASRSLWVSHPPQIHWDCSRPQSSGGTGPGSGVPAGFGTGYTCFPIPTLGEWIIIASPTLFPPSLPSLSSKDNHHHATNQWPGREFIKKIRILVLFLFFSPPRPLSLSLSNFTQCIISLPPFVHPCI